MVAMHLLNENEPSFGLKPLCEKYFGDNAITEKKNLITGALACGLIKTLPNTEASEKTTINKVMGNLYELYMPLVAIYAIKDIILTYKLFLFIQDNLNNHKNKRLIDVFKTSIEYNKVIFELDEGVRK